MGYTYIYVYMYINFHITTCSMLSRDVSWVIMGRVQRLTHNRTHPYAIHVYTKEHVTKNTVSNSKVCTMGWKCKMQVNVLCWGMSRTKKKWNKNKGQGQRLPKCADKLM